MVVIKKLRFLDKIGGKTMTWDELNKKYPEARDKMSIDRKRDFLKDLYNAYATVGFVDEFWNTFTMELNTVLS